MKFELLPFHSVFKELNIADQLSKEPSTMVAILASDEIELVAFQHVFKGLNKIAALYFKEAVTFHGVAHGEILKEASSRMQSSTICSSEYIINFKLD